jgi:hypothetical protein
MRSVRRKGFLMLYVLVLIALLAAAMILLADASGSMAHETRRQYLQACERNLAASALAWVAKNGIPEEASKRLDVEALSIPEAQVEVEAPLASETPATFCLRVSCGEGIGTLRRRITCQLPAGVTH